MNRITDYLTGIRRISKLHESMLKEYVCQEYGLTLAEATVISFLYNNPGRDTAADIVELRMLQKEMCLRRWRLWCKRVWCGGTRMRETGERFICLSQRKVSPSCGRWRK